MFSLKPSSAQILVFMEEENDIAEIKVLFMYVASYIICNNEKKTLIIHRISHYKKIKKYYHGLIFFFLILNKLRKNFIIKNFITLK